MNNADSNYDPTRIDAEPADVNFEELVPAIDRYQVLGQPLQGGMGLVYPANDSKLNRRVAIKRIRPEFVSDQDFLIRFRKEASAMAVLDHPNLVSVYDLLEDQHGPMIVMQWVSGQSVAQLLRHDQVISPQLAADIIRQVAHAMHVVHAAGINHRDLKPANILVDEAKNAYVTDFGLARLQVQSATVAGETITGALLGTVDFVSPEQLNDPRQATPQSDIWSLGATFYQMLTGHSVRGMRPDRIPEAYRDVILTATEYDPQHRFQSMEHFAKALETTSGTHEASPPAEPEIPRRSGAGSSPVQPGVSGDDDLALLLQKTQENVSRLHAQAIQLMEQHYDYARAVEVLDQIPEHLRKSDVYEKATRCARRVKELDDSIRVSVKEVRLSGVRELIEELLELQPSRREPFERLLAQLPKEPPKARRPALLTAPFDAATAQASQQGWADHLDMDVEVANDLGMKFRVIPPGTFLMGSPEDEGNRSDGESQHEVTITEPKLVGVYPVTQGEWRQLMGNNPSHFNSILAEYTDRFPVEKVSWDDCQEFIAKLNAEHVLSGWRYRLPTEAEWEWFCRAGTTTPFHFGETLNGTEANCDGNHPYGSGEGPYLKRPSVVGSFSANAFGLYDCHGNVWEWCSDWHDEAYYFGSSPLEDPPGPTSGSERVLRGGSWDYVARHCRSAFRHGGPPSSRNDNGLRLLCELS